MLSICQTQNNNLIEALLQSERRYSTYVSVGGHLQGKKMNNVVDFPRKKTADKQTEHLMKALIIECQKLGMNTTNADFVFDMTWVQQFVQATVDNQNNLANDLCRLTRAQGAPSCREQSLRICRLKKHYEFFVRKSKMLE